MQINKKTITIVAVIIGLAVLIGVYIAIRSVSSSLKKIESAAFSPTEQTIPCNGNPSSKIEIVNPFSVGSANGEVMPSEFVVTGGNTFVVVKNIRRTAVLDFGNTSTIHIGRHGQSWKEQDKSIIKLDVREGEYNEIALDPGQYWIWIDRGSIEIVSCTPNGVSYPLPQK